jgi:hypothetical protein
VVFHRTSCLLDGGPRCIVFRTGSDPSRLRALFAYGA